MTATSIQQTIAIVELCVYAPVFLLTVVVAFRHGFARQLGWVFLAIFTVIRIVGAIFEWNSIKHPGDTTDIEWAAILQSVGLSPLLLASHGLLKRIVDQVTVHAVARRTRAIQLAHVPTIIALVLCIVGGTNQTSSNPSTASSGKTYTRVGVVLFVLIYILLFGLVIITGKDVGNARRGDKRIYFAVLIALPLLAVRLLWSTLSAFTTNPSFQIGGDQPLVQVFMATVEEFIIVLMYTLAGLTAPSGLNVENSVRMGRK